MPHQIESDFQAVARNRKNFIQRDAQIEIAKEIYDFLTSKWTGLPPEKQSKESYPSLLVEAGTGIGKSLAYLLPLIRANKKAIVSTNTKALQKQLSFELVSLRKQYPSLVFKVLQGASNYACLLKADDAESPKIRNWVNEQLRTNGDGMIDSFKKENKKFEKDLWKEVSTESSLCSTKCPFYSQCFYQNAKSDAANANIVILNHDLLLLKYKNETDVLFPGAEAIVIDESHHFPEKSRNALSISLTNNKISKFIFLLNWKFAHVHKSHAQLDIELYQTLEEELFDFFPTENQETRIKEYHEDLLKTSARIVKELQEDSDRLPQPLSAEKHMLRNLASEISRIFKSDSNWIKIYSCKNTNKEIKAVPLDVAPLLSNMFLQKPVVMTSATLRSGKSFDFFKAQVGQNKALTLQHASPFDRNNVTIFIPLEEIDPNSKNYHEKLTHYMVEIHKKMRGRSLFLFSNKEDMDSCRKNLDDSLKKQFFFQTHTAEIPAMVGALKSQDNLSLAGLSALWEGIDIVGKSLSCVCVMRLPFNNPEDILSTAIKEKVTKENSLSDYEFFDRYEIPQMLLKLKQGFGRLVRHETDTGLLAMLDNRFMRKSYRNKLIELLEDFNCYSDLDEAISCIPSFSSTRFHKITEDLK